MARERHASSFPTNNQDVDEYIPLVVQPLLPKAEVEHGECAIAGDLLVHREELWQSAGNKYDQKFDTG